MGTAEFALNLIIELLGGAIQAGVAYTTLPFFQRRRIDRRVEEATAEVIEPLFPFLSKEGISEERQRLLLETCVAELKPLSQNPEALFRGSLNGQKIFEDLYRDRELPAVIVEEGLRDTYALICPRIATLLCRIPAAVKDWETEAWSESFRRLDDIGQQLRSLFVQVDQLADQPSRQAGGTLSTVRRALAQKIGLDLDLTGLRGDSPTAAKFVDLFVHPEISHIHEKKGQPRPISVGQPAEAFGVFSHRDGRAIVIGPPGSGKSTWSKWLQSEALSPRWGGIAVRAELRQLAGAELPSIQDLVRSVAGKHFAEELTLEILNRWFDEGLVLFLLDGFDEIRPSERDGVIDWITDLVAVARSCPFVLTSRPLTTDHLARLSGTWKTWNMEAFDKQRVVDYIGRWYRFTPLLTDTKRGVDGERLAQGWLADPTLGPLTGNPLLLSTLLTVHHLDGSLPSGRSQLYRRYVEGMLGLWDDRRQVAASQVSLTLEQKRRVLRAMALHFFLGGHEQIDEPEIVEWLGNHLAAGRIDTSPEELLAAYRERSGLVIGPGVYSFAHKSIAEYLVAEAVLQGDQSDANGRLDRFRLFEFRADDRWNTVTFLWAGLASIVDLESFIEACREAGELRLAGGLLDDQADRLPREIRRQLLLGLLRGLDTLKEAERIPGMPPLDGVVLELKTPGIWSDRIAQIYMPTLRSLTPHKFFFWPIASAKNDGVLIWSDIQELTNSHARELFWWVFSSADTNIDAWRVRLKELVLMDPGAEYARAFHILENMAMVGSLGDFDKLRVGLEVFCQELPDFAALVPVAVFAGVVSAHKILKRVDADGMNDLLEFLAGGSAPQSDKALLLATRDWQQSNPDDGSTSDLLEDFMKLFLAMEKSEPAAFSRVNAYVENLRGLRALLAGNTP